MVACRSRKGNIYRGIVTGLNNAFVIDEDTKRRLINEDPASAEVIKPFLAGRDIKGYKRPISDKYVIFTRRGIDISKYPAILAHLQEFKQQLMPKPEDWKGEWKGRKPGSYKWYEIQDSTEYYREFEKDKIIYPNICKKPEFTFDDELYYTNQKCFIISKSDKYLLGILNSKLNLFLFEMILPKLRGGFFEPSYVSFKNFPIRTIDFSNPEDVAKHDKIVSLVEQMLDMNKKLDNSKLGVEKEMIQRRIAATDSEINRLVYQLYDLTEEEIKIVEMK